LFWHVTFYEDNGAPGSAQGLGGQMTSSKPDETLQQVVAKILEVAHMVKDIEPKLF